MGVIIINRGVIIINRGVIIINVLIIIVFNIENTNLGTTTFFLCIAYEFKNTDLVSFQHNVLTGIWISFIRALEKTK